MTTFEMQACPLCDGPAEFCRVDYGNRKYFDCPTCTYFQLSVRAERLLAQASEARKQHYAALAAQTPDEHLLVIRVPDDVHRQVSSDPLQATYVAKSELSLD